MKRLKILLPILIVIGALLACGESSNTGTLANGTPSHSVGNTPTAAPAKHFKIGDTVIVGDNAWKVVVNSIQTNQGNDYEQPKGIYVVINVSLTNTSSKEDDLSSFNFTFKNVDGTKYDISYVSGLDGVSEMPTGKVEPADVVKGDLVYDVPTSAKTFTFSFEPDVFSSGQTIWDLSL